MAVPGNSPCGQTVQCPVRREQIIIIVIIIKRFFKTQLMSSPQLYAAEDAAEDAAELSMLSIKVHNSTIRRSQEKASSL